MRFRLVVTLMVSALACIVFPALAQQPGGKGRGGPPGGFSGGMGGGFGTSRLFLLRVPEVQKELELVDEQLTAIQKLQEELGGGRGRGGTPGNDGKRGREPGNAGDDGKKSNSGALRSVPADWYFVQAQEQNQPQGQGRRGFGGQPPTDEERAQFEQQRLERAHQEKAKLAEILLPHQMKRLTEIYIQQAGAAALDDEDIAKELNITADQKAQMAKVRDENRQTLGPQMRDLFQPGGDQEAARAKMAELRKAGDDKVFAVLNAAQKAKFEEMKGKPFDLPEGALRAAFGGRGGPPGGQRGKGGPPKGNNN
jgi:hypothetical protein